MVQEQLEQITDSIIRVGNKIIIILTIVVIALCFLSYFFEFHTIHGNNNNINNNNSSNNINNSNIIVEPQGGTYYSIGYILIIYSRPLLRTIICCQHDPPGEQKRQKLWSVKYYKQSKSIDRRG